jgi:hypothetical protein
MQPAPPSPDHLRQAGWLLIGLAVFCVLALVPVIGGSLRPSGGVDSTAAGLMRALDLTTPALIPSGRPLRAPETLLPGVDWRFAPGLPLAGTGPGMGAPAGTQSRVAP